MLGRLLRNLKLQETGGLFDLSIVVVDNDPAGLARESVLRLKAELAIEIEFGIEPERTIAAARNHALRLARGNYIAIIDDDEFPPQNWLITLYRAIQTYDVDGALGPIFPFFTQAPPRWLVKGRFCERPIYRTGALLKWEQTRTGNVLLKRDVFDKINLRFDTSWKTSGSDRAFFKQAMLSGFKFVAVEEAPVYELVPAERWKRSYYVRRSLVQGFNAQKNRSREMSGFAVGLQTLKSIATLVVWALALPLLACFGNILLVKCLEKGGYHLSRFLAVFGIELIKERNF